MKIDVKMNGNILVLTSSGNLMDSEKKQFLEDFFSFVRENNPRYVLIDSRKLEGRFSIGDIFFQVKDISLRTDRTYEKVAIVERQEFHEKIEFYRVAAWNAGLRLNFFYDYDSALDWFKT